MICQACWLQYDWFIYINILEHSVITRHKRILVVLNEIYSIFFEGEKRLAIQTTQNVIYLKIWRCLYCECLFLIWSASIKIYIQLLYPSFSLITCTVCGVMVNNVTVFQYRTYIRHLCKTSSCSTKATAYSYVCKSHEVRIKLFSKNWLEYRNIC